MLTKRGFVALALLAVGGVVGGWGESAHALTLDTLIGAGSFTVGNATYSNFSYGGVADPATVTVTASTITPGTSDISFGRTSGPWTLADNGSVITFHVAFATPVTQLGLSFIGSAVDGAVASVGETASSPSNDYSLQVVTGVGPSVFTTSQTFATPESSFDIVKSIDISGAVGDATITTVDNTYTVPTPEPASLGVLALGGLALIRRRRR